MRHVLAELRRVANAETEIHARFRRHLTAILVLTLGVDLICAVLAYLFEHNAAHSQVRTFWTALFWTSTQLLTVSSQLPNPISTSAHILDVFMEFWAVTVVASLAATMGAFLIRRGEADA